jgi:hypothetical protein
MEPVMAFPSKDLILPCIPRDHLKKIRVEFTEDLITKIVSHMQHRRIIRDMLDVCVSLAIRENLLITQENLDHRFSKHVELSKSDFSKIHEIFKNGFIECAKKIPIE